MSRLTRLSAEQRSNLVAYLDGELDEEETQAIEEVLAVSTVARNDVEALARTYEMLDALPREGASEGFTQKTVETAQLEETVKTGTSWPWREYVATWGTLLAVLVGVFAISAAAFLATYRWIERPSETVVRELPLIQRLDVYTEIADREFLERLSAQDRLLSEMESQVRERNR